MSRFVIRTDSGPDMTVDTSTLRGRVELVDSKTCKVVGHMSLYSGKKNVVIHTVDRRRKAGDCVLAWVFAHPLKVEAALAVSGGGRGIKELLQKCGYQDPTIIIDIDSVVVD